MADPRRLGHLAHGCGLRLVGLRQIERIQPEAVVVDAPEANEDYLKALRRTGVTG